jgi:hypothetical protein
LKSEKPELSEQQQQTLRDQAITELAPGTLLHDFAVLLDFIAANDLVATGLHQLLPLAALPALNSRLANPLTLKLQRPVQKSYPHINGLFLLGRATGLLRVIRQPKAAHLRLDAAAFEAWQPLNPTERYFTLLEAYLLHASPEMIGERGGWRDLPGLGHECKVILERIGAKGIRVPRGKSSNNYVYKVWLHHFALLELFGFVRIKPGPALPGQGWNIAEVQQNPFGQAMMMIIARAQASYFGELFSAEWEDEPEPVAPPEFNRYQADFQPYFPAWQRRYTLADQARFTEGVYQFKVSLGKIWRRIAIPATASLDELSGAILKAVDFDNDHLHCFEYKNRFGVTARVNHPAMDEPPYSHEVRVGDLPLAPGDTMEYIFDFGDNWEFQVLLENIAPPDKKLKRARLLEAKGKAPQQYPDWEE